MGRLESDDDMEDGYIDLNLWRFKIFTGINNFIFFIYFFDNMLKSVLRK
jgi:hypothetical protein